MKRGKSSISCDDVNIEFVPADRARAAAEIILAMQMENGMPGALDMSPKEFEPFGLDHVAGAIRRAVETGERGFAEVLAHAITAAPDQLAQDSIRTAIVTISQSCTPELISPVRMERQARIVRQYNAQQRLRTVASHYNETGEGAGDLAESLGALRESINCKGLLERFRVDHQCTLGLTLTEIEGLRPPFVIDRFVRRGEVMILAAESKSRKSWLAQDAGICVATGTAWLADEHGGNGFGVNRAKVWVLDLELPDSEAAFRFAKVRHSRWPHDPDAQHMATENYNTYSLDGMNVAEVIPLLEELRAAVKPGDLVVIDCFYRLVADGNETSDVAAMFESIKRFAKETGAAVIVVDHFRKAGDDKARNRIAGSFVKQAGPATIVAIEVKQDGVLEMSIDARTFYGCPTAFARFDLDSYTFHRIPEVEIMAAREAKATADAEGWLVSVWRSLALDAPTTAVAAKDRWDITRQQATTRLRKLVNRGWLTENSNGTGKAISWLLTESGGEIVKRALNLK